MPAVLSVSVKAVGAGVAINIRDDRPRHAPRLRVARGVQAHAAWAFATFETVDVVEEIAVTQPTSEINC